MKRTRVASLVPGRVSGKIEKNPTQSGSNKILVLRQEQLVDLSAPPGGLILVEGALFSHPIIQWLGREIPMAIMDAAQAAHWEEQEYVVLDSVSGEIRTAEAAAKPEPWHAPAPPDLGQPVRTLDGTEVRLSASVAGKTGVRNAITRGAASVGLVRTEYLFPDDASPPTADFYLRVFSELLTLARPLVVSIRMLDLASDKWPTWLARADSGDTLRSLHGSQLYAFEAVRDVVDAQLEALGLGVENGRVRLIWPSGGCLEEFVSWRDRARIALSPSIALGAMVESPLEMLALDRWRTDADFISVGCNDLLQHLCAADRDDPRQRLLLDPYRPELFGFLRDVAKRAGTELEQLQLCGLLPQIEGVLPILIGLGYRCFSGEPNLIPLLARGLIGGTVTECVALATEVCTARSSAEVRELLDIPIGSPWGLARDKAE